MLTELAEKSLREFTSQAWELLEPETVFVPGWHIDAICDHLEAVSAHQIKKLLITVPPGHMKSLLSCVMWPAWVWLRQPWTRWLFASYSSDLSIRDNNKMRRLIASDWYRQRWGNRFTVVKDHETRVETDKNGFRIATSVGGLGTGERVHFSVNDDLLRANDAMSEAMRKQATEHLRAMSTRGVDPATYCQVLIMQRLHESDPAGFVLEQGGWEHLNLPAEYEATRMISIGGANTKVDTRSIKTAIGWADPRKQPGELLWPQLYPAHEIASLKRALGSYGASGQLQQRPAPAEGGVIKRHWFNRFDIRQRPPSFDQIVLSADPKFKDYETKSRVAIHVVGRIGRRKYLLDRAIDHFGIVETLAQIYAMRNTWNRPQDSLLIDAYLIEDKANGPAIMEVLRKKLSGVIAIQPRGSKEARVIAVSPQMEAGDVWIPTEPWGDEVIDALCFVPNGDNWDDVDALSQALDYFGRSDDLNASDLVVVGADMTSAQSPSLIF